VRQIILDTETTGLYPDKGHRIIEIGCLEMINRRLTGSTLHFYLNPQRDIERAASEVHGLTISFLADKPLFKDIADELITYLKNAELIIHNAPFDIAFIDQELKLSGKSFMTMNEYCTVTDTLTMARHKHPGQHNNLDALCRRYHVDNSNRQYHGALLDAELLAQVYLAMTGGQTQMFDSTDQTESSQKTVVRRVKIDRVPLPIIKANADELKAHEEFMNLLKEQRE
jgi:DNA polymerase-3 subunit epsilon